MENHFVEIIRNKKRRSMLFGSYSDRNSILLFVLPPAGVLVKNIFDSKTFSPLTDVSNYCVSNFYISLSQKSRGAIAPL